MKYINIAGIVLYALLGFLLSMAGVGVVKQTGLFLAILGIVVLIDINSAWMVFKTRDSE